MTLLDLLILALATWRTAYFISNESGPFALMDKARSRFPLGGLLSCLKCASVWVALALYALWLTPLQPIVAILAISGAALMLASYTGVSHA